MESKTLSEFTICFAPPPQKIPLDDNDDNDDDTNQWPSVDVHVQLYLRCSSPKTININRKATEVNNNKFDRNTKRTPKNINSM